MTKAILRAVSDQVEPADTNAEPKIATPDGVVTNPFANLDALRNPQDYDEFLGGEVVSQFAVRTLKDSVHLRVNPNPSYTLVGQYTVSTRNGTYFVYPQFRDALGPLPRRCNLHVAVNGHGEYFLLLIKQPNPGHEDNPWYTTARAVAAAAAQGWVKVTKPPGADGGWGYIPVRHNMFEPTWPEKPFEELLASAFPDRVVNKIDHDLIQQFAERGCVMLLPFDEIVLADFEFNGKEGNRPNVVCVAWRELRSGRRGHLWQDQLGAEPPYRIDDKTLFVAFYASAELTCHLVLGWQLPNNILDLYAEFRCLRNHTGDKQPPTGLLDAMDHCGLDCIDARTKEHWRDVVLRGEPWSAEEPPGILDYCESDVACLEKLLPAMPIPNLGQSLLRGNYMRADAWMRHRGIPIDKPLFDDMSTLGRVASGADRRPKPTLPFL
jgi:hypothetical protein